LTLSSTSPARGYAAGLILFGASSVYRIRKGLNPREAVIVRLGTANFKENYEINVE
jgi:hypothetical protein